MSSTTNLYLYLFVWLAGLGLVVCVVWDSLRLGISPMPSSKKSFEALKEHLPVLEPGTICELGAGWGGVVRKLTSHYPQHQIIAYENALLSWLFLRLRFRGQSKVRITRQNFLRCPLPKAQLYYTYLYPEGMNALSEKLKSELKQDSILVSFTFALPGYTPSKTITLSDLYRSKIYLYELKGQPAT